MAKERALTLEALRVMDAIDRRGSFAAAADELGRVPSALSYTMQKLEEELDVVLFDRSGHRTKFTNVGRMLLERGRVLLEAADKITTAALAPSRGWGTHPPPVSRTPWPPPGPCSPAPRSASALRAAAGSPGVRGFAPSPRHRRPPPAAHGQYR
ncbi:LysR family transcriptional regulator, partial [Klebsiella pneumoniae]|nr:LysR family transcriptional regulator [Klebsiella pneumoniae]